MSGSPKILQQRGAGAMTEVKRWTSIMREDWNDRAEESLTHSNSWHASADVETFYRDGGLFAKEFMEPVLGRLGFTPKGKRALEIGCGIGRLFPGCAALGFEEIWGVDVSPAMVEQARQLCPVPHAKVILGDGQDLGDFADASVDYCYSYNTFPHVPDERILWRYVGEVQRVLRQGGVFQLHFRASNPLKARLVRRLPFQLRPAARALYQAATFQWVNGGRFHLHNPTVPGRDDTWFGACLRPSAATRRFQELGAEQIQVEADLAKRPDGHFYWISGRKAA